MAMDLLHPADRDPWLKDRGERGKRGKRVIMKGSISGCHSQDYEVG